MSFPPHTGCEAREGYIAICVIFSCVQFVSTDTACLLTGLPVGFSGGSDAKESACRAGDLSSVPRSGRSPREGNGNPLQYFCLETPMDRVVHVRHDRETSTFASGLLWCSSQPFYSAEQPEGSF